jgi:hypothetical protein
MAVQVSKLERQVRSSLWGQIVYLELPGTSAKADERMLFLHLCHSDVVIRHEVNGLRAIVNDNLSKHMEGLSVRLCLYLFPRSQASSNTLVADRVSPTLGGCCEQESR